MSEELLKIADGLLAVSEGVRALAGKAHSCNCSKNQEEGRGQKDEESGNEMIGAIKELATEVKYMRGDLNETIERLNKLESKDGDKWEKFKWLIVAGLMRFLIL